MTGRNCLLSHQSTIGFIFGVVVSIFMSKLAFSADRDVSLTRQVETAPGTDRYHRIRTTESWRMQETAVIVCDVWDSHHSLNAVRRVGEVAPRINSLVSELRKQGATIIHAPSDCMPQYVEHPARKRAINTPKAKNIPTDIDRWCDRIPSEEQAKYPVDQSDGGEDDDPLELLQWHDVLAARGRNPKLPWKFQTSLIQIQDDEDFISDSGPEIWSILEQRKIQHILLCGVHTNMCVLGRPFGLRQLNSHGKQAVLVRDLTDTMYNPRSWPFVNHFSGTDLVIDHAERFVCSTTTSDQFLPTPSFRFSADHRPHLVMLIAEDEYKTEQTLPAFADQHLRRDFQVSYVLDDASNKNRLVGLDAIDSADALLISVRRRPLPKEDLDRIKRFVEKGKPVIGIRTASHAFSLRDGTPGAGLSQWPEFDEQVFGGRYTNHHGNELHPEIFPEAEAPFAILPVVRQSNVRLLTSQGSLYRVSPLFSGTRTVATGKVEGEDSEPVAWTFVRRDSGRSFYTSLGHESDFEQDLFRAILVNGIHWAVDAPTRTTEAEVAEQRVKYAGGGGKQRK